MNIKDRLIARGRRTASRIYSNVAYIILLPKNSRDHLGQQSFVLGKSSSLIWKLIENKTTVRGLISRFCKKRRIRVSREIEVAILKNVRQLIKNEIVEVVDKNYEKYDTWLRKGIE